jgi:hypothetical protein
MSLPRKRCPNFDELKANYKQRSIKKNITIAITKDSNFLSSKAIFPVISILILSFKILRQI